MPGGLHGPVSRELLAGRHAPPVDSGNERDFGTLDRRVGNLNLGLRPPIPLLAVQMLTHLCFELRDVGVADRIVVPKGNYNLDQPTARQTNALVRETIPAVGLHRLAREVHSRIRTWMAVTIRIFHHEFISEKIDYIRIVPKD